MNGGGLYFEAFTKAWPMHETKFGNNRQDSHVKCTLQFLKYSEPVKFYIKNLVSDSRNDRYGFNYNSSVILIRNSSNSYPIISIQQIQYNQINTNRSSLTYRFRTKHNSAVKNNILSIVIPSEDDIGKPSECRIFPADNQTTTLWLNKLVIRTNWIKWHHCNSSVLSFS